MANREKMAIGEYYHIYNRGVDKRSIVKGSKDADRFIQSLEFFNSKTPVSSLRQGMSSERDQKPLVEVVCYCLNHNHFHLLMKEIQEGGISEFMKRLGGGYTWYFNNKYHRSGALFQGVFKSTHITSNEQLLHVSAYVGLNWKVHKIRGETAVNVRSSWNEYLGKSHHSLCSKNIILGQFRSVREYKEFAESSLKHMLRVKIDKDNPEMLVGRYLL